jgi:cytochrome c peroxidase
MTYRHFLSLLVCLVVARPILLVAQSSDRAEESTRRALIMYLSSTRAPTIDKLLPFYRRPSTIPRRPSNFANQDAIIALGRRLFFDQRLSRSGSISCATCHDPKRFWTDGLPQSIEGNSRRSMSLYNLAWDSRFTWRGETGTLMSQSIQAFSAGKGMALPPPELVAVLNELPEYEPLFRAAFPEHTGPLGAGLVAHAIEAFVGSILSGTAAFDRWVEGDENAVTDQAKAGFLLFHGKANCARCHNLWRFSDSQIYDIGSSPTGAPAGTAFKAVGLRNIAMRPPYMHHGSLNTLEAVIDFYNQGGVHRREGLSRHIKPLGLTPEDREKLVAFLKTLTAEQVETVPGDE